jgi:hypothetical protein
MLASLLRPKKRREYAQSSLFPSPYTRDESRWPLLNETARGGQKPGYGVLYGNVETNEEDTEEESVEDEDADAEDEDAPIESTPLLPIFSAPHLGTAPVTMKEFGTVLTDFVSLIRYSSGLRRYTCDPILDYLAVRNHPYLGPTPIASDFAILGEANPTENQSFALFKSYTLRIDDELPSIRQGSSFEPRKQRHQPHSCDGERASCDQAPQGLHNPRID